MTSMVERLASTDDLDGVLAIEEASFNNPTTRDWYEGELKRPDVCFIYVLRTAEHAGRRVSAPSGWSPIRRTSTIWPFDLSSAAAASGPNSWKRSSPRRAHLGAASLTLEVRESNMPALQLVCQSAGFTGAGVRKNYYTKPVEDALVLSENPVTLEIPLTLCYIPPS